MKQNDVCDPCSEDTSAEVLASDPVDSKAKGCLNSYLHLQTRLANRRQHIAVRYLAPVQCRPDFRSLSRAGKPQLLQELSLHSVHVGGPSGAF